MKFTRPIMRSENFKQANRSRFSSENLNVPEGRQLRKEVMLSEKYFHEHTFVNFIFRTASLVLSEKSWKRRI
jgi:hypothetical protein